MPELPEVETIVRGLGRELKNKTIAAVKILDKKVVELSGGELKNLIGQKIISVNRRAKMIVINLATDRLVIHLKMTGQLAHKSKNEIMAGGHPIQSEGRKFPNKFTRAIFKFNDKSSLYFNDVRRFGWIRLNSAAEFSALEERLGVEPLTADFSLEYFKKILARKRNTTIKQALLDQKYVSGIGNIYADESLFSARISPFRRVKTLKPAEIKKIWLAIPKILRLAIKHRGTSFSDYVDVKGETGNFIKYLKVYGRAGEKCRSCGGVVKKTKLGGRGTHWCEICQK